jgi:hypothetical protein
MFPPEPSRTLIPFRSVCVTMGDGRAILDQADQTSRLRKSFAGRKPSAGCREQRAACSAKAKASSG